MKNKKLKWTKPKLEDLLEYALMLVPLLRTILTHHVFQAETLLMEAVAVWMELWGFSPTPDNNFPLH
jgi:hypothetical protein